MAGYRTPRIFPIALVLILMAIAIIGLVYAAQMLFFSGGNTKPKSDTSQAALLNTSVSHSVLMTVRGQIVADENFRTYQIKIAPNARTFTTYKGYLNEKLENVSLYNNVPAYEQFVYALDRAKFMDSNEFTGDNNDTRGICATGFLYEFSIMDSNKTIKKLWTTTCAGERGSFRVAVAPITNLFVVQIPNVQEKINALW